MKPKINEMLSNHTTFKIGGSANFFFEPKTIEELRKAITFAKKNKLKLLILGAGSNLLISDKGFSGCVIKPSMQKILIDEREVEVEAGVPLAKLINVLAEKGLCGLEFLAGIPGSLGGAILMNAGAKENEIGNIVDKVWTLDLSGREKVFTKKASKFGYRGSIFQKGGYVITKATFILNKKEPEKIKAKIKKILDDRLTRQPYDLPSAGSVFKNPLGDFAGRLIESAGFKGKRVGDAMVSPKHCNFIVNMGHAKYNEVFMLINAIKYEVKKRFGVALELEIKCIMDYHENEKR